MGKRAVKAKFELRLRKGGAGIFHRVLQPRDCTAAMGRNCGEAIPPLLDVQSRSKLPHSKTYRSTVKGMSVPTVKVFPLASFSAPPLSFKSSPMLYTTYPLSSFLYRSG